jgi:hypothetical protein
MPDPLHTQPLALTDAENQTARLPAEIVSAMFVVVLHGESLNRQGRASQMLADGYTIDQISALQVEEEAIM